MAEPFSVSFLYKCAHLLIYFTLTHADSFTWFWVKGRCYGVSAQTREYSVAEDTFKCDSRSVVDTVALLDGMNPFLDNVLGGATEFWVGARKSSGTYQWETTGADVASDLWQDGVTPTRECVSMSRTTVNGVDVMRLVDRDCSTSLYYVCQKSDATCPGEAVTPPPEDTTVGSTDVSTDSLTSKPTVTTTQQTTVTSQAATTPDTDITTASPYTTETMTSESTVSQDTIVTTESDTTVQPTAEVTSETSTATTPDTDITTASRDTTETVTSVTTTVSQDTTLTTESDTTVQPTAAVTSETPTSYEVTTTETTWQPDVTTTETTSQNDVTTKEITSQAPSVRTTTPKPHKLCPCACTSSSAQPAPAEEIEDIVQQIQKELTVDKTTLSKTTRKKTSATDERKSAVATGSVGIVFFACVFGLLVFFDLQNIYVRLRHRK